MDAAMAEVTMDPTMAEVTELLARMSTATSEPRASGAAADSGGGAEEQHQAGEADPSSSQPRQRLWRWRGHA